MDDIAEVNDFDFVVAESINVLALTACGSAIEDACGNGPRGNMATGSVDPVNEKSSCCLELSAIDEVGSSVNDKA